ncbi:MAG: DUF302 domain-containing protein [Alphaproteobacteria bacterium]|nr:DUF302 domain-containing protein [Alphaproteobacteria bacterium]
MSYYFSTTIAADNIDDAVERVLEALKQEGFGVLTDIDIKATMKKKLDLDFRPYRILGACNPPLAHQALTAEDKIGALLPCNVVVQEAAGGFEVAAVDPVASMASVDNATLAEIAPLVRDKLVKVIQSL